MKYRAALILTVLLSNDLYSQCTLPTELCNLDYFPSPLPLVISSVTIPYAPEIDITSDGAGESLCDEK